MFEGQTEEEEKNKTFHFYYSKNYNRSGHVYTTVISRHLGLKNELKNVFYLISKKSREKKTISTDVENFFFLILYAETENISIVNILHLL